MTSGGPVRYAQDLLLSVRSSPGPAGRNAAAGAGAASAVVEPASWFVDWFEQNKTLVLIIALVGVSAIWVHATHHPRRRTLERLGATIELGFGDLFETGGVRIVAVNDFFDANIGTHVAPSSLHGQLIGREFEGNAKLFRAVVDRALSKTDGTREVRRSGRERRYPIGTTATVRNGGSSYVLAALGYTDPETAKVSASISQLAMTLENAWSEARSAANGEPVVCPLMGSGLSGINMTNHHLAGLILASAMESNGQQKVSHTIRLVLPETQYGRIHLDHLLDTIKD